MQQTLTAKLQIFPKPSDRQLLFDTTKAYSAACTYVSDYVHANHTPLNIFHIQKATYQTCRESFGLRSQMAVSVTRTVIAAYKSVRTNQRQHSGRFSKKKRHIDIKPSFRAPQLSLVWNRDYSLIKNTDKTERLFSVNTLRGRIKCPFRADSMDWAFDEGAVYGTAKLIFRHGKFFLYVPVTINVPDTPAPSSCKKVVGIDRGIRFQDFLLFRRSGQTETGPLQRTPPSAPETADVLRETQDPRHRAERKPLDERCEPSYL